MRVANQGRDAFLDRMLERVDYVLLAMYYKLKNIYYQPDVVDLAKVEGGGKLPTPTLFCVRRRVHTFWVR